MSSRKYFEDMINLADERLGARALAASDEFFAPKENLLKPGRGVFLPDEYTDRGKWMDGWETRRKRVPGYDWCEIKLGLAGIIRGVDIDTNHFLGNHPPEASLDVAEVAEGRHPTADDWREVLPKVKLERGSQNLFEIKTQVRATHVRLNIYPDGGVARLRVYGEAVPDWQRLLKEDEIDLASLVNGGLVLGCNDMFFSHASNMLRPDNGRNMGDGWETRRRREPGHDWSIIRLGAIGRVRRLVVDTAFFKGNYPDRCSVDACLAPDASFEELKTSSAWKTILPESKLEADRLHYFERLVDEGPFSHLRLNIYPDGGISRFRAFGKAERPLTGTRA